MTSEMLQEIANKVSCALQKVVIVDDPDGLLATESVRCQLEQIIGFHVVAADGIALRVHYELNVRGRERARACYVRHAKSLILWDIARDARIVSISIADFFPNFVDRQTLANLDFHTLEKLFDKHIQGRVTSDKLQSLIKENTEVADLMEERPLDVLRQCAEVPDWSEAHFSERFGKAFKQILAERTYDEEIDKLISDINFDFQHYLQDTYFATLNSSGGPKAVHAVAGYLQHRFSANDKLAFIVVDGMAWWQWEVLRDVLEHEKLLPMPQVKAILAWLPSITALSRQALFRGATPVIDYRQTPNEEERLWKQMWKSNPIYSPIYQHNITSPEELNTSTRRLAIVDVQLDKKMHQSSDYYDLYDLTRNWAMKFAKIIERLLHENYKIVLTTDHGNVLAESVGTLKQEEKVHLYLTNSKGERFVYFHNKDLWRKFRDRHSTMQFFFNPHDTWLSMADNSCFSSSKKQLITHCGSHFMETVLPLIIF